MGTTLLTVFAIPVFIAANQVAWLEALVLAIGFAGGGALGSRIAVRGGERVIRSWFTGYVRFANTPAT